MIKAARSYQKKCQSTSDFKLGVTEHTSSHLGGRDSKSLGGQTTGLHIEFRPAKAT